MRAGDLRDVISIQKPTVIEDDIGGQSEGPPTTVVADLPAAVEDLALGQERITAGQLRGSVTKRVRIRYREDVTDDMTVLWKNRTLEIGLVQLLQQDGETRLLCAEVQG